MIIRLKRRSIRRVIAIMIAQLPRRYLLKTTAENRGLTFTVMTIVAKTVLDAETVKVVKYIIPLNFVGDEKFGAGLAKLSFDVAEAMLAESERRSK